MFTRRRHTASTVRSGRSALKGALSNTPARFAISVFSFLILLLTALLMLPISTNSRTVTPLVDALFTAVSAICVTGLSTVDMSTHWSLFGDIAIVIGAQIGGIGVLSLASILGLTVTRRLGLKQRLMAASDASSPQRSGSELAQGDAIRLGEMRGLLSSIAISTFVIELALFVLLAPRLMLAGYDPLHSLWYGGYLAITTFTNTGFVPMPDEMDRFIGDPYMLGVMSVGVFLGSIGFPVIFALWRYLAQRGWSTHKRFGLHTKLTLSTTLILIIGGWLLIAALEWDNRQTLGSQDLRSPRWSKSSSR